VVIATIDESLIDSSIASQVDPPVQHVNSRLQHDLDLWQRIKEYDKKPAKEPPFTVVLTKKQKQIMKTELLDGKPPYSTRSSGTSPTPR